ncbi:hypothetical protein Tco_0149278 [Tanacetum coccineum]
MLKKFGLEDSKLMKTPMSSDTKLTKDEECESIDSTKYRGMIGSLLYLTASRPDIMFSVCLCDRFQEAPKTFHLEAVKRIFRYIKGTTHLGLWYPKGTGKETVVYANSDHAGDYVDLKSTSGACVFTDKWRHDELAYGIPSDVYRIRYEEEIDVLEYQVLIHEIEPTLKPLDEIIQENVFCLRAKQIEWVTKQKWLILPYGMLLTRLFKFISRENPKLENESYVLYDRVMTPLAAQLEQKPKRDRGTRRGRHSTSSSSSFDQLSSSHLNDDDDDGNDEGTSRASTPSPIRYVNSLTNQVP